MNDPAPPRDPMARATRTMGIITAVLTGLVAFNTLVYSCSNDRDSREKAELDRLAAEEHFWAEAMKDLSGLVGDKKNGPDSALNWNKQCFLLGARTLQLVTKGNAATNIDPELALEFSRVKNAQMRVDTLRGEFQRSISSKDLVGAECAQRFGEAAEKANQIATEDGSLEDDNPNYETDSLVQDAIENRLPSIQLTRLSESGWDVDVFWCARSDKAAQEANFNRAIFEGKSLAAIVQSNGRVFGQKLGRIRVRRLSLEAQIPKGAIVYYNRGNNVLYDKDNLLEQSMAKEIAALSNSKTQSNVVFGPAQGALKAMPQVRPSQWYLSLFICKAGEIANATSVASEVAVPEALGK